MIKKNIKQNKITASYAANDNTTHIPFQALDHVAQFLPSTCAALLLIDLKINHPSHFVIYLSANTNYQLN